MPGTVLRDGTPFTQKVLVADANFLSLTRLPLVSGTAADALDGTGSIALSVRMAEKYFGRRDVVGQRITVRLQEARDFIVQAVFETLPETSHMDVDVIVPFDAYFASGPDEIRAIPDDWGDPISSPMSA
ncbi:ABC transporter permease [Nitrospirillum sp. BR 11163]|uniref:ABC transporter permease n=1 Tax=Nitrospirillum sp. BR 11163 TaxID=3104323 RepID=UPI002AFFCBB1|nr:ABC transporter permease [Nitrospirillum sp. BR 11163]MEA1671951.1 ABC transporter permease [Nitrospirillum sp. BR 11163]